VTVPPGAPMRQPHVMLMMGMASPDLAELAFLAGIHSVILDCEHGFPLGPEIRPMLLTAQANGGRCMVRIPPSEAAQVGVLADLGVDAILLSAVRTLGQVIEASARAAFPGDGTRSLNPFVPAAGVPGDAAALSKSAEALGIWAMAETAEFLEDLERLQPRAPGGDRPGSLTGVIIGPYDLSADLGCQPDPLDGELRRAVGRFVDGAEALGLEWGLFVRDTDALRQWNDVGVRPRTIVLGYDRDLWFQACLARCNDILSLEGGRETDGS
jgi:2-keto-3-deoxy-L-rhamnonate aldolase RhmA